MFLTIRRTFGEALKNFVRNGWLSIATVSILVMSLFVLSVFFVVTSTVDNILKDTQNKIDISISFKADVSEQSILEAKANLESFDAVKSVNYVPKELALENFKRDSALKPIILQALDAIGSNPLLDALVVKANDPTGYDKISEYVAQFPFSSDVSRTNYNDHADTINKLNNIVRIVRKIGIALGSLFAAISLLIIFNAIQITIYTHRQEIEIMRLVGASNFFIRLPFIFEGIIYGIVGALFSMLILFLSMKFVAPFVSSAVPSSNLIAFYFSNFGTLLGGQIFIGSFLGVIGSLIAMRKYLKV
jgi:cell division transport system permease protein